MREHIEQLAAECCRLEEVVRFLEIDERKLHRNAAFFAPEYSPHDYIIGGHFYRGCKLSIVKPALTAHRERIRVLELIEQNAPISHEGHALLLAMPVFAADPIIANYKHFLGAAPSAAAEERSGLSM